MTCVDCGKEITGAANKRRCDDCNYKRRQEYYIAWRKERKEPGGDEVKERKCAVCGAEFPAGTPASRKYCTRCAEQKEKENRAKNRQKLKAAAAEKAAASQQPRILKAADRKYCEKCIYVGNFSENYLCGFLLQTGEVRGCKAGVGCKRRITGKEIKALPKSEARRCEKCGRKFDGGKYARFCDECRAELQRQAGRHMAEARRNQ